jgi:dTDP-glucose pyrophosphorylase
MLNKQIFIHLGASIKDALKQLDKTAVKILLVVDTQQKLLGTISDGDVRRYLLQGKDLNGTIDDLYNRSPRSVQASRISASTIREFFLKNKLTILPVLDVNGKVIKTLSWENVFSKGEISNVRKKRLNVPVVIMAGGKGTRLDPVTKVLPKPLIPIGDKPIIEIIMDRFCEYGIKKFYITLNYKSRMIKAFFEDLNSSSKSKYNIVYIDEKKPLGTGGSLKLLQNKIQGPFFVSNTDILIEADYNEILKFHIENKNDITLVASIKNFDIPYGVCEIENGGTLLKIREKPEFNFLVNTGMYIVNSNMIRIIPRNQMYHLTHLMEDVKARKGKVGVYPISDKSWIDIGEWEKYRKALELFEI